MIIRDQTYWTLISRIGDEWGLWNDRMNHTSRRQVLEALERIAKANLYTVLFEDYPLGKPRRRAAWMRKNGFRVVQVRETIVEVTTKRKASS